MQRLVSIYNIKLWKKAAVQQIQSIQFNSPQMSKTHKFLLSCSERTGNVRMWLKRTNPAEILTLGLFLGFATLPRMSAPSSGAGCCGDRWHGHARSSSDRADSHDTVGTDTGNPSCSRSGNKNIPPDGRLGGGEGVFNPY